MPLVTVCIPTYNRRRYLLESLDSIFRQTWTDFEVLLVDDGSTDGTAEAIRSYPHPVRYIYQEHQGEPAARNRLIAETRTPFLAWQDSDDLWLPEKLEKQMVLLEGAPERTIVYSPLVTIDAEGRVVRRQKRHTPSGRIVEPLFERFFIPFPSVVMPTQLARECGGFPSRYLRGGDYRFWLVLSLRCDFLACPEPLVLCRRHGGNLSNDPGTKRVMVEVLEEFYFELGGQAVLDRGRALRRLSHACHSAAKLARQERKWMEARVLAEKALRYRATPRTLLTYLASRLGLFLL
jgi:glycosyltransferase involved in cell wall biosynthesis